MWVIAMLRLYEHIQTSPFIQQLFLQRFNLNVYIHLYRDLLATKHVCGMDCALYTRTHTCVYKRCVCMWFTFMYTCVDHTHTHRRHIGGWVSACCTETPERWGCNWYWSPRSVYWAKYLLQCVLPKYIMLPCWYWVFGQCTCWTVRWCCRVRCTSHCPTGRDIHPLLPTAAISSVRAESPDRSHNSAHCTIQYLGAIFKSVHCAYL